MVTDDDRTRSVPRDSEGFPRCPECGAEVRPDDWPFCPVCYKKIGEGYDD